MKNSRRTFLVSATVLASTLGTGRVVFAQATRLDPKDAKARDLGYVEIATKADKNKYPTYADGQNCSNCVLFTSKPGAADGPCEIFPNTVVPVGAWCGAWETA